MPATPRQTPTFKMHVNRPSPLPVAHTNPLIKHIDSARLPQVKFQEITREGQVTVVGRIKVQTPSGHAFILRRLDTGAISQTTMFRAAFPTAPEDAEQTEAAYVRAAHDNAGANRSGKARFAGTWVAPDAALVLAGDYGLLPLVRVLVDAAPDPGATFRKARKDGTPAGSPAQASPHAHPPSKRARHDGGIMNTSSAIVAESVSPAPAPPTPATPGPRRSTRLRSKSPAPAPAPKTPRSAKARSAEVPTAASLASDATAVDEDAEVQSVAAPKMVEDVREQRELIARLKAERDAARREAEAAKEKEEARTSEESEMEVVQEEKDPGLKRPREDEQLAFNFKENQEEVQERAIATNRRVALLSNMPPERKSLAWGALAFAAGLGAVSLIPHLQQFF